MELGVGSSTVVQMTGGEGEAPVTFFWPYDGEMRWAVLVSKLQTGAGLRLNPPANYSYPLDMRPDSFSCGGFASR